MCLALTILNITLTPSVFVWVMLTRARSYEIDPLRTIRAVQIKFVNHDNSCIAVSHGM